MTKTEKKLSVLKKGKAKMAPGGNRTSEVDSKVSAGKTAVQDYIQRDNISASDQVTQRLKIQIEEHGDFDTAVYFINCAINNTQAKVNEEKAAANNDK